MVLVHSCGYLCGPIAQSEGGGPSERHRRACGYRAAEALREQVSDAIWQAYLSGITPLSIKEHEILLGVPNKLIRDRVESAVPRTDPGHGHRHPRPRPHRPPRGPRPARRPGAPTAGRDEAEPGPAADAAAARPAAPPPGRRPRVSPVLDPRYTFETFVTASSNRFAHAAAQSVAETPGPLLQPAVHLRRLRPGQDPPPPRHRQLRARELPRPQRCAT